MADFLSFAHLKKGGEVAVEAVTAREDKEKKEKALLIHEEKKAGGQQQGQQQEHIGQPRSKAGIQIGNRSGLKPTDRLMQSRFCYGCPRFTVDAPDTDQEVGFCLRELPKSAMFQHEWKIIRPETMIRQCLEVKRGKLVLKR